MPPGGVHGGVDSGNCCLAIAYDGAKSSPPDVHSNDNLNVATRFSQITISEPSLLEHSDRNVHSASKAIERADETEFPQEHDDELMEYPWNIEFSM